MNNDDDSDDREQPPTPTTFQAPPPRRFVALEVSREMLIALRPIVPMLRKHDRELAIQLLRAANSVHLNIGESQGRAGGDRRKCFEVAAGSAFEVEAALDAADAWGWIGDARTARRIIRRVIGLLWGLRGGAR